MTRNLLHRRDVPKLFLLHDLDDYRQTFHKPVVHSGEDTLALPPEPDPDAGLEFGVRSWRKGDEQEAIQGGGDREQAA